MNFLLPAGQLFMNMAAKFLEEACEFKKKARTAVFTSLVNWKVLVRKKVKHCSLSISVNKQLGDKERVAAALENSHLLKVVNQCLSS
jgi:hypothetical protein